MEQDPSSFVFLPLGGLGEIGMNVSLYGYGAHANRRKWIMVDLGLTFAGPDKPGVELLLPNLSFIEKHREDLLALFITHAHEDHIGAVADCWPKLQCPIYATPFAASLLRARQLADSRFPKIPIHIVKPGDQIDVGLFSVEYIKMAHSIPEATALAIRTDVGTVLHSGDWRLDPTPVVGWQTDEVRLKAIGKESVLALVSDSTNMMREGSSASEAEVAVTLREIIAQSPHRVIVTTFASNVARIKSAAEAAMATGRSVILVGRAMERITNIARECGYLEGLPAFLPSHAYASMDRDKVVVLVTGSQGEDRAAMSRIAQETHPHVHLTPGDRVIFSSHTIPGNERVVNKVINQLVDQNVEVITERTHLVHVSGHPRPDEVEKLYQWIRPHIAIPIHGESFHLAQHAAFAKEKGVPHVFNIRNGDMIALGPGEPEHIAHVANGPMCKDGHLLILAEDEALEMRSKLASAGCISIGLALTKKGRLAGDPDMILTGLPQRTVDGEDMALFIDRTLFKALDRYVGRHYRDINRIAREIEKAIRTAIKEVWGKKPVVHVLVTQVKE